MSEQTRQGVNRQKEETNDVAAAMNEMTATVQEVARNASEAANSAHEADGSAKQGRQVVAAAIEAINLVATDVSRWARPLPAWTRTARTSARYWM